MVNTADRHKNPGTFMLGVRQLVLNADRHYAYHLDNLQPRGVNALNTGQTPRRCLHLPESAMAHGGTKPAPRLKLTIMHHGHPRAVAIPPRTIQETLSSRSPAMPGLG